jgi:hypothetical protein
MINFVVNVKIRFGITTRTVVRYSVSWYLRVILAHLQSTIRKLRWYLRVTQKPRISPGAFIRTPSRSVRVRGYLAHLGRCAGVPFALRP